MDTYSTGSDGNLVDESSQDLKGFSFVVVISQLFGLASVFFILFWLTEYKGGFSWADNVFNYHPLFMILGFVFLYGESILIYRVFRYYRKIYVKIAHAVIHLSALTFASIGLRAVFVSHSRSNAPNLYSLHAWMGIGAISLFSFQWLLGFLAFLYPKFSEENRKRVIGLHQYLGGAVFVLTIATSLLGITELNVNSGQYNKFLTPEMVGNALGLCLIVFGALVLFILTRRDYRRVEPMEADNYLLQH